MLGLPNLGARGLAGMALGFHGLGEVNVDCLLEQLWVTPLLELYSL